MFLRLCLCNSVFLLVECREHDMGHKLTDITLQQVQTTAEALQKAASQLSVAALKLMENNMEEVALPWNKRQWACLDVIVTSVGEVSKSVDQAILAKLQGRPSHQEIVLERRAKRQASKPLDELVKSPGRPRKDGLK